MTTAPSDKFILSVIYGYPEENRKEIRGIGICAQFGYVERKIKGFRWLIIETMC